MGRSVSWEAPQSNRVLEEVPYDLTRMPARDLLTLPLLLEDEREVAEESVWKVIAPKGVAVLVQPEDEAAALGRLRGMQMVEVELAVGPWLKLKKTAGWVRAQGGTRGALAAHTPARHAFHLQLLQQRGAWVTATRLDAIPAAPDSGALDSGHLMADVWRMRGAGKEIYMVRQGKQLGF